MIEIKAIQNLPIFQLNDNLVDIIIQSFSNFCDGDILIIAHTIISRIEGSEIKLDSINPSSLAKNLSKINNRDPRHLEAILQQTKSILRMSDNLIIAETLHGFICANAGIDKSNARPGHVVSLPSDSDKSAREIQEKFYNLIGKKLGIIISDTFGRPFRRGTTNIAIGVAGIEPIKTFHGQKDLFNYKLQTTESCIADELATAGGLLMGQAGEGTPVILIRGYKTNIQLPSVKKSSAKEIIRPRESALFW